MKRCSILVIVLGLLVVSFGVLQHAPVASAQEAGWVTLFDGSKLEGWNRVGNANWRLADGAVQADSGSGFLVSPVSYGDFQMRVEVWVDADANSGVFIRCADPQKIGAASLLRGQCLRQASGPGIPDRRHRRRGQGDGAG